LAILHEESSINQERKKVAYLALAVIAGLIVFEGYNAFVLHKPSIMGIGYNFVLLGLWLWRCMYTYSYTIKDGQFIVERQGMGKKKTMTIDLSQAFCFNSGYKSSIFRRTKVNRFQHRYSSLDGNRQRLLVYKHGSQLRGLLFKSSDKFSEQLQKQLPQECFLGNI
jgi:hypothetical protein